MTFTMTCKHRAYLQTCEDRRLVLYGATLMILPADCLSATLVDPAHLLASIVGLPLSLDTVSSCYHAMPLPTSTSMIQHVPVALLSTRAWRVLSSQLVLGVTIRRHCVQTRAWTSDQKRLFPVFVKGPCAVLCCLQEL